MLQFRNAFDIGGLYWCINLILSQASVVACALLYHLYYEEDNAGADLATIPHNETTNSTGSAAVKLSEEHLKASVGSLISIFLISFTLFVLKIERKYLWTFFSTETGHAKAKRLHRTGKNDFEKSLIVGNNKRQWMSIRGEVAEWLDQNWDRWERDKPDWFNAVFIDKVDDDIMPARVLARLKQEAEGGERRRSSFVERLSVRERVAGEEERGSESDSSGGEEED